MDKKFDTNLLKAAVVMSTLFTLILCVAFYEIFSEPFLVYNLGKVLKNGDLSPFMLTLRLALPVLFLAIIISMFSIAYYKADIETPTKREVERTIKKRKTRKKKTKKEE